MPTPAPTCLPAAASSARAAAALLAQRDAITNWGELAAANNITGWSAEAAAELCSGWTGVECDVEGGNVTGL